jgi:hypothetical protein
MAASPTSHLHFKLNFSELVISDAGFRTRDVTASLSARPYDPLRTPKGPCPAQLYDIRLPLARAYKSSRGGGSESVAISGPPWGRRAFQVVACKALNAPQQTQQDPTEDCWSLINFKLQRLYYPIFWLRFERPFVKVIVLISRVVDIYAETCLPPPRERRNQHQRQVCSLAVRCMCR